LAAGVREGGRILEIGTGVGTGCAWIVHGLGSRTDVEVVSVELDDDCAAAAASVEWPDYVQLHHGDALELLGSLGTFDLIFPDAPAGKWTGLDRTIAALAARGLLIVDDMIPKPDFPAEWISALERTRSKLLAHPDLVTVEIDDLTGVVLCARRPRN
jgi:demethylmenaquinone methyltransferase/2-methoxy-6-polyprenyl-1,4-benzoquinol methylase